MTQNEKDLVLKDLCARLPYGVNMATGYGRGVLTSIRINDSNERLGINIDPTLIRMFSVNDVKPYLFPLSSMTEEQWIDTPYANLNKFTFDSFKCGCSTLAFETYEVNLSYVVEFINWCYKNHFDVYGLIPMGLANDATGLNIY